MMQFLIHVVSSVIGLFLTCCIWLGAVWLYDKVTGHRDEDEEREEGVRNCDVGTIDEQFKRFDDYCIAHHTRVGTVAFVCCECPLFKERNCAIAWAHMPYEEEEEE